MEASANLADASMLMRKIGFIVVLLRGLLFFPRFLFRKKKSGPR